VRRPTQRWSRLRPSVWYAYFHVPRVGRSGSAGDVGRHENMYGVPKKLKALRDFVGARLAAVDDLETIVYFRFASDQATAKFDIGVEGDLELRARTGEVLAEGSPKPKNQTFAPILQSTVIAAETRAPRSIAILFASGTPSKSSTTRSNTSPFQFRIATSTSGAHRPTLRCSGLRPAGMYACFMFFAAGRSR
jgi:hypothetical protein